MRTIAGGSGQNTSVFLKPNDLSSLDPQLQDEIKNVFASTVKEGFYGSSNAGISVSLSTP